MKIKSFFSRQVNRILNLHGTNSQNRPWINQEDVSVQSENIRKIYNAAKGNPSDKSFERIIHSYASFSKFQFRKGYQTTQITVGVAFLAFILAAIVFFHFLGRVISDTQPNSLSFFVASACASLIILLHFLMHTHTLWKIRNLCNNNIYCFFQEIQRDPKQILPLPLGLDVLEKIENLWSQKKI